VKITLFGLTLSSSWGNGHATPYRALLRALSQKGHAVTFFENDMPYYARRRDFSSCDYCQLVLYPRWEDICGIALREAADSDVVIVGSYCPEGARIIDDVLTLARPLHVFYDLDTPITLEKLRNGEAEHLRRSQISAFELYLSFTGGAILEELEREWGAQMVRPLYGCVDPGVYVRTARRREFICDFSYMGTYAADRQSKLEKLFLEPARRARERVFLLAGALYPDEHSWPSNVRRFEHLAPGLHPAFYSSCRLTLNITRGKMAQSGYCPSGRFFEASACGTPILSDWWEGLEHFFAPGAEIAIASSGADVMTYLGAPDQELQAMADRARERTLDEHTGERRADELLIHLDAAFRRAQSYSPKSCSPRSHSVEAA
jgi:spore maturation protein CgeB